MTANRSAPRRPLPAFRRSSLDTGAGLRDSRLSARLGCSYPWICQRLSAHVAMFGP